MPCLLRSVLTGSYHNYFKIYDVESGSDTLLQADKSAFKAKKIGGVKSGPKGKQGQMETTGIDFNKKIVSATFAQACVGTLPLTISTSLAPNSFTAAGILARTRLRSPRPTTSSSTRPSNRLLVKPCARLRPARHSLRPALPSVRSRPPQLVSPSIQSSRPSFVEFGRQRGPQIPPSLPGSTPFHALSFASPFSRFSTGAFPTFFVSSPQPPSFLGVVFPLLFRVLFKSNSTPSPSPVVFSTSPSLSSFRTLLDY